MVLPPRNWMNAAGVVAKSSAGTSEKLELTVADPDTLVREFRAAGYRILSAGIRDSVSVFDEPLCYPLLLVVGGEKRGISRGEILKIIKITVKKVQKGYTMEAVAEDLEESVDTLRPIYEAVEKAAPDYDAEKIYESLDK